MPISVVAGVTLIVLWIWCCCCRKTKTSLKYATWPCYGAGLYLCCRLRIDKTSKAEREEKVRLMDRQTTRCVA